MKTVLSLLTAILILASAAIAQPAGDAAEKPAPHTDIDMVLIHGIASSAAAWDKLVPFLETGFRLWVYELPGHGETKPVGTLTLDTATQGLETYMLDKQISNPVLVGHGIGGMIAMNYAYRYSEDVRKLIIIDATPIQLASLDTKTHIADQLLDNYDAFISDYFLGLSADPAVTETIVDQAMRCDQVSVTQLLMSSFDFDLTEDLAFSETPLLVIGSGSMLPDPEIALLQLDAMGYANAQTIDYKSMPEAGHFVMLERPRSIVSAIVGFSITD